MKTAEKAIAIGVISFIGSFLLNIAVGGMLGAVIPSGDGLANSYFYPLYTGVVVLTAIVITCTYLTVKKIKMILELERL